MSATPTIVPAAVEIAAATRARRLRATRRAVLIGLLIAGGLIMIVPFLWMITTSLKTRAEVFAISADAPPDGPAVVQLPGTCGTPCRSRLFVKSL